MEYTIKILDIRPIEPTLLAVRDALKKEMLELPAYGDVIDAVFTTKGSGAIEAVVSFGGAVEQVRQRLDGKVFKEIQF